MYIKKISSWPFRLYTNSLVSTHFYAVRETRALKMSTKKLRYPENGWSMGGRVKTKT